jgi:hypothetical protein
VVRAIWHGYADGLLACETQAPVKVVIKHAATVIYLVITFIVLTKTISSTLKQ